MAETTTDETEMTRGEAATLLRTIADELDSGRRRVEIPVGNKQIQLSAPGTVDAVTTVTERSRRLRKDTEELSLSFNWDVDAEADEPGSDPDPESRTDPEMGR